MTTFQKVIKYLALGFAAFLIFLIVSGVFEILFSFSSVLGLQKKDNMVVEKMYFLLHLQWYRGGFRMQP